MSIEGPQTILTMRICLPVHWCTYWHLPYG